MIISVPLRQVLFATEIQKYDDTGYFPVLMPYKLLLRIRGFPLFTEHLG